MERINIPKLVLVTGIVLFLLATLTISSFGNAVESPIAVSRVHPRSLSDTISAVDEDLHASILEDDSIVSVAYNGSSAGPHAKRVWPFDSAVYTKYRGKGCKFWDMLLHRENVPLTPYNQFADLQTWGWVNTPDNTADQIARLIGSIQTPLESLGLSVTADKNVDIHSDHSAQGGPDRSYPPTNARYFEVYNPSQGAIIAYRNYGPEYYATNDPSWGDKPLPKLKQFSDIVFLTWLSITSQDERRNLRYVVRVNIMNEDTRDVIEEALKKDGMSSGQAPAWPGHKFTPEENLGAFQAVLGTPNVSGVVWLLVQHEGELGKRTVKSITAWDKSGMENQNAGTLPSLVIEIGPA